MTNSQLPDELTRFIRSTIPSYDAAVVLLLVARVEERAWSPPEVAERTGLSREAAENHLEHFVRTEILARTTDGAYRFHPTSDSSRHAVIALHKAYEQLPVTLIRVIYSAADEKIRAFADSFKLKRE